MHSVSPLLLSIVVSSCPNLLEGTYFSSIAASCVAVHDSSNGRFDKRDDLQAIIGALRDWQSSIITLRIRCERIDDSGITNGADVKWVEDHIWNDRGQRKFHYVLYRNDTMRGRGMFIFDGMKAYHARYNDGTSAENEPDGVDIGPTYHAKGTAVGPLLGLWDPSEEKWLCDTLQEKGAFDGYETVGQSQYPRVKVIESKKSVEITRKFVLDPEHGFLPKRFDTRTARGSSQTETDEFRETDSGIWFPWVIRFISKSSDGEVNAKSTYRAIEVNINHELDPDVFRPVIPPGTQVADQFSGKSFIQPGPGMREKHEARLAAQAQANIAKAPGSAAGERTISAVPQRTSLFVWVACLVTLGISALVTGIWLSRRKRST